MYLGAPPRRHSPPSMLPAATAVLLAAVAAGAWAALPLPEYVRPCSLKISDRKFSQCALERAQEVMPKALKGDEKYSIPSFDPLYVDRLEVIDGKGPLGMQLLASDVKIHGLPKMIVSTVTHISKPKHIDTYVASVPEVTVNAKYNISGRILLLPIVGQGNVVMKFKNLKITYQFNGEIEKRQDGEFYYVPQPGALLDVEVDGMTVHLDNLFNGDKTLVETTNQFLNTEWKEVFESLKPSFTKEISRMITNLLNSIYTQVPMKNAFLDFDEFMKTDRFQPIDKSGGR
ncbi:hypothetical protein R5R35_001265 [Gryllus longicercus]